MVPPWCVLTWRVGVRKRQAFLLSSWKGTNSTNSAPPTCRTSSKPTYLPQNPISEHQHSQGKAHRDPRKHSAHNNDFRIYASSTTKYQSIIRCYWQQLLSHISKDVKHTWKMTLVLQLFSCAQIQKLVVLREEKWQGSSVEKVSFQGQGHHQGAPQGEPISYKIHG